MRVISEKALREFWKVHPDAEQALRTWLALANRATWRTPEDIKRDFASASFLANNRVVFNIRANNYRLVVLVLYRPAYLYIRFIGTHAEYDRIGAYTV
jgi:mRNA interferase HigB